MKVFHLFPYEKFTNDFIEKTNLLFNSKDHLFFVYGDKNVKYPKVNFSNVFFSNSFKSKTKLYKFIFLQFLSADKIIFQSLFLNEDMLKYVTILQPIFGHKYYWDIWGGDLYDLYRANSQISKYCKKYYRVEFYRKILIRNMSNIVAMNKKDYFLAKQWYHSKAKYFYAFYPIKLPNKLYQPYNSSCINILAGNSASIENRHIDILNKLSFIKNKEVKIYCPLSYPSFINKEGYIKSVINYGHKIFGDKFIPITNFMFIKDYIDLLNEIDIGIFNNNRQQAGGNIAALLSLGKKVYVCNENIFYSFWKNKKVKIFNYNNLNIEAFERLLTDTESVDNSIIVNDVLSNKSFYQAWDKVYNT